jgi:hypothetical protein
MRLIIVQTGLGTEAQEALVIFIQMSIHNIGSACNKHSVRNITCTPRHHMYIQHRNFSIRTATPASPVPDHRLRDHEKAMNRDQHYHHRCRPDLAQLELVAMVAP